MGSKTQLRTISIGRVAKDILEDDPYIDIYPIELQPSSDGEITASTNYSNTVTDTAGNVKVINLSKTSIIKAKWIPDGDTNRLEPPTVCKGEIVRIYQYGDAEEFYWNTLYNQLELRKLEKRTIVVSNKQSIDIPPEELLDNSYSFTMDTINKIVHLRTSTTDGEYTSYDITIDTAEGMLEIIDGKENRIILESQDDRLTISINKEIITNTEITETNSSVSETTNTDIYENNSATSITNNTDVSTNNSDTSITNNTTDSINNSSGSIVNNTGSKTDNIDAKYMINLKQFAVDNGTDELISVLSDFVQAVNDAVGIGNMGVPVPMDGTTQAALGAIKSKIDGFK